MRSVDKIIESRNKLNEAICKITEAMKEIGDKEKTPENKNLITKLYGLRNNYKTQATTLNFVLNEDNTLDDYKKHPYFMELEDYLIDFD